MSGVELSVVVPAYNEADSLPALAERVAEVVGPLVESGYELVIVNDGSRDATEQVMRRLAEADPRVVPVNLSRNFGKESAIAAGLSAASGQCVVLIDADLQHPPEVIGEMIARWREGYAVVNAVKERRNRESFAYRWSAGLFNRWMTRLIGADMAGASDFKLLDREVVDVILDLPERNRFFRGLVAWVGFPVAEVKFSVAERRHGESKWRLRDLVRYSISNIVAFSAFPLLLIAYLGFATAAVGALLLLQTLYNYFAGTAAIGFTTVIALQIMIGGIILLAIGVISVYIGKIYEEQKSRPVFIVRRKPRPSGEGRPEPGAF